MLPKGKEFLVGWQRPCRHMALSPESAGQLGFPAQTHQTSSCLPVLTVPFLIPNSQKNPTQKNHPQKKPQQNKTPSTSALFLPRPRKEAGDPGLTLLSPELSWGSWLGVAHLSQSFLPFTAQPRKQAGAGEVFSGRAPSNHFISQEE